MIVKGLCGKQMAGVHLLRGVECNNSCLGNMINICHFCRKRLKYFWTAKQVWRSLFLNWGITLLRLLGKIHAKVLEGRLCPTVRPVGFRRNNVDSSLAMNQRSSSSPSHSCPVWWFIAAGCSTSWTWGRQMTMWHACCVRHCWDVKQSC